MRVEAFFSDTGDDYCAPSEPEAGQTVTIRFRASCEDRPEVFLLRMDKEEELAMAETERKGRFCYYACEAEIGEHPLRWCFRVREGEETLFYDQRGACGELRPEAAFQLIPGFHTPDWAKGAIMYQIFVDRFCRGDSSNDVLDDEYIYIGLPVRRIEDWNELPSAFDVGYFYGGDLPGVRKKLQYLKGLGVEVLYFNPLFVSPSNHKYDTQDYEHIDPHLTVIAKDEGETLPPDAENNLRASRYMCRTADPENLEASDRFFAEFVQEAHELGFRILLDGVFNHCGSFHKWMDREKIYRNRGGYEPGAYESRESPYHDYFAFSEDREEAWPDNRSYDGWWNNDTLPKLNYEASEELEKKVLEIAGKWLRPPYSADGWRLDVAADLGHSQFYNHLFWSRFRSAVKAENPDAFILAEHYGDPSPWLNGREWDSVMNYDAFMEPVSWFLTGMEKHSDRFEPFLMGDGAGFWERMSAAMARFPRVSLLTAMNQLSNHDHSRFLTRTGGKTGRLQELGSEAAGEGVKLHVMRQAALMLMTWIGAPTIYYGDEAGVCGWTDPDSRRSYPWGRENLELLEFHRYLGAIHRRFEALRLGSLIPLRMERSLVSYGRVCGDQRAAVFVYTGEQETELHLPVWLLGGEEAGTARRVMLTDLVGYNVGEKTEEIRDGILSVRAGAHSAGIFIV